MSPRSGCEASSQPLKPLLSCGRKGGSQIFAQKGGRVTERQVGHVATPPTSQRRLHMLKPPLPCTIDRENLSDHLVNVCQLVNGCQHTTPHKGKGEARTPLLAKPPPRSPFCPGTQNIDRSPIEDGTSTRHSERLREIALPSPLRLLKSPFGTVPPTPPSQTTAAQRPTAAAPEADALADYRLQRVLGKGGFGLVTLLRCKRSGALVAAKTFQRSELSTRQQKTVAREVRANLAHTPELYGRAFHPAALSYSPSSPTWLPKAPRRKPQQLCELRAPL